MLMDKKPTPARSYKSIAVAAKRAMGKPDSERTKQIGAKRGQVEAKISHLPRIGKSDGRTVERVRIVFASDCQPCPDCGEPFCVVCQQHYADCQCPGPGNAEELGYNIVEENGVLYGVRGRYA